MSRITLPVSIESEIKSHALTDTPREVCGMLGGKAGTVTTRYPLRNLSSNPDTGYFAAPEDLFTAMKQMRDSGEDLLSIYHSHPRGPAYPSTTDIALAYYPQIVYLVVALNPTPSISAFNIRNGTVEPAELIVQNE